MNLSINVNKIALLRNSRGTNHPDLIAVATTILNLPGVAGLTVHPRPDARHITYDDVAALSHLIRRNYPNAALNVEGYPSDDFLALIQGTHPHQVTLVPDAPDALTSTAGWDLARDRDQLLQTIGILKAYNTQVSLFLDPILPESAQSVLRQLAPDAIELHTYQYALQYPKDPRQAMQPYSHVARTIHHNTGCDIHAGHDLNQANLSYFIQHMPVLHEVSIGHAIICDTVTYGLPDIIGRYTHLCDSTG